MQFCIGSHHRHLRNRRTKTKNKKKKSSLGFAVNRLHSIYFVEDFFTSRKHIEMKIEEKKKINSKIELKIIMFSFQSFRLVVIGWRLIATQRFHVCLVFRFGFDRHKIVHELRVKCGSKSTISD